MPISIDAITRLSLSLATLIISLAVLVWSMGNANALYTPAVSLGMNPVVTFYCYSTNNTYTVPSGMDLIITDISSYSSMSINSDSTTVWEHYGNTSNTSSTICLWAFRCFRVSVLMFMGYRVGFFGFRTEYI